MISFEDLQKETELEKTEVSYSDSTVFSPLPLTNRLDAPRDQKFGRSITYVVLVISGLLAFWFFTNKQFRNTTGLNVLSSICIYAIVGSFAAYFILTKFVFKVDEKVRERAISGDANKNLALSEVWNISNGGISEIEFFNSIRGTVVNYHGCPALIYSTMLGSTSGRGIGADEVHYDCNQYILDYIINAGYSRLKINLKYDTANDNIWEYTRERIYSVSGQVTSDYVNIMNDILKYQYDYTKDNSRVSCKYNIIKMKPNSTISEVVELYNVILNINKQGSLNHVKLLSLSEFQSLIQRYYGFQHIDLSNVVPKTTMKNTLGDTKIIKMKDSILGESTLHKPTEVEVLKNFYDNPYVEVVDIGKDIASIVPEVDIFKD